MKKDKRLLGVFMIMLVGLIALLSACGSTSSNANSEQDGLSKEETSNEKADWPEKIALGVLPGEEEGEMSRGNEILANDMAEALGIEVELYVGQDYNAVIEAMRSKKIDIANYGPFSYILAAERSNAVPFAIRGITVDDAFYKSYIIVPDESDVQTLEDLKGKSILFADPASTSGHLFPRMMFVKGLGIDNDKIESFFGNVSFSGGHDNSVMAIAAGDADAAGVSSSTVEKMVEKGLIKESDFRIIKESDPIPSNPFTYRGDLPESLVTEIKEFFYNYDNQEFFDKSPKPEARYFEINDDKYQVIRDTAEALNMSPEELLK